MVAAKPATTNFHKGLYLLLILMLLPLQKLYCLCLAWCSALPSEDLMDKVKQILHYSTHQFTSPHWTTPSPTPPWSLPCALVDLCFRAKERLAPQTDKALIIVFQSFILESIHLWQKSLLHYLLITALYFGICLADKLISFSIPSKPLISLLGLSSSFTLAFIMTVELQGNALCWLYLVIK